ncbi:MAG: hypothetical protein V4590_07105 [Bacteroidota bacterium]
MKITFILILILFSYNSYSQKKKDVHGEAEYLLHYNCKYEPGNLLIVQKKGKSIPNYEHVWTISNAGFVIRMEAIYDLEFSDGKRFRSGVIKNITDDSITISSTMNEACAAYEGIMYEFFTYPLIAIKIARFVNDRSLGIYKRKKIMGRFDMIVKKVDTAKMCPAVLTFPKRNYEVKVCHYYLTSQGYDILFETNGFLDYMPYPITSY